MTAARDTVRTASAVLLATAVVAGAISLAAEPPRGGQRAEAAAARGADPAWSVPAPGQLADDLADADLLVLGKQTIPSRTRTTIERLDGIRGSEKLAVASAPLGDRVITVAAVDPGSYRRFTPPSTATAHGVWRAVAAGEVALTHQLSRSVEQPLGGQLALRAGPRDVRLRIGAHATTVPRIDAVVNYRRGQQLGMTPDNALLLSLREGNPDGTARAVRRAARDHAAVYQLGGAVAEGGREQLAHLSGSAVADAVGTFQYRYFPDGSVRPDPAWVTANIRTEQVPILGRVTCHRVMLPQLRSALSEVKARGLADAIDPDDYGGCYAPRFIGRDPANGLSLHTWGIAVDLNVSQNQRGTPGRIHGDVVRVFQRWGFAWGGRWAWTDPMHFELAALVR